MSWLDRFSADQPVAHGLLVLCAVAALGLAFGSLRWRGLTLGVAGTLFAGVVFGHLRINIDPEVRHFIQELGLILFVYTIGIQVGPGFLTSFRKQGLALNLLAASIVLSGGALTIVLCALLGVPMASGAGIFAGATTNTPALGAASQALKMVSPQEAILPGLSYATCYPFGILGIIFAMMIVRRWFRIDPKAELKEFKIIERAGRESLRRMNLRVENPNLEGLAIRQVPGPKELDVVFSRIKPAGSAEVGAVTGQTILHQGDTLLAIGTPSALEKVRVIMGRLSEEDLMTLPGPVIHRRVVVTRREVLGKSLRELAMDQVYGVTATRLTRADLEMPVSADLQLQFGDMIQLVGTDEALLRTAATLGNSVQELNHTKLIPVFVGILLGVLVGSIPFTLPHVPVPVRLGLAGGPLLVAMILSRVGRIGPLLWYMPVNANVLLREFGIVLFLACVGLRSGEQFLNSLLGGQGLLWMLIGAVVTLVPLLGAAWFARRVLRTNYLNLCGLLAGSMTDPPALAFANAHLQSEAPSVAYATVYPLTMLLRIVVAQLLVLFFGGGG